MDVQTAKAEFAVEFIDLPKAAQVDGANWEPFQIQYLNNQSRFAIDVKARQIAWSFTAALDAVVDSIINPGWPHIFVSINQEEAQEKIRYTKNVLEAIDAPARPTIVRSSTTGVELTNRSRFISHPSRPPRGKAGTRIYLDELAHYQDGMDRTIYTAALPATVKGDGYIRIGSSPLGAKGLFWEIFTESINKFPGFVRGLIPWWHVHALCKDVKSAKELAPSMLTEERVRAFGMRPLVEIFENMFLEDFQQEYECAWVDELTAWITWQVIKRNQDPELLWWHAKSVDEAMSMVYDVRQAILDSKIEGVMCGGIDVGRDRNLTEFIALGLGTTAQMPVRFMVSLDRVEFDDQQACLTKMLEVLPFTSVLVDRNSIGRQLSEGLEKTGRAEGVDFTNESKELWAVESRLQAERGNTPLPVDRDLAYQIHSIKKTVTAAKNNRFDTEKNEKHHADKYWAWALALWAGKSGSSDYGGAGKIDDYKSRWT